MSGMFESKLMMEASTYSHKEASGEPPEFALGQHRVLQMMMCPQMFPIGDMIEELDSEFDLGSTHEPINIIII